jgi:hypothetical protein
MSYMGLSLLLQGGKVRQCHRTSHSKLYVRQCGGDQVSRVIRRHSFLLYTAVLSITTSLLRLLVRLPCFRSLFLLD